MKKALFILLALLLLLPALPALGDEEPPYVYEKLEDKTSYDSDTLTYSIETGMLSGTKVYLTRIWMAEPGKQIVKKTAQYHKHLATAEGLAAKVPGAAIVINGSGYVSGAYPWIPENYPGESKDYHYTPLGSLVVTDGEVIRNLEGVPYYGLTLEADGLHLYVGADNEEVLSHSPTQTWSFYVECPLIRDGESILDRENWPFALRKAIRTIIAKLDEHSYVILTVTSVHGLPLTVCTDFLLGEFQPEWAYNLDGGPSSALLRRKQGKKKPALIYGAGQKIVDIMAFIELPEE